jgi:plasmid stabilization system protein ParE
MPPRRGLVCFGWWFYKDFTPTALWFAQLPPPSRKNIRWQYPERFPYRVIYEVLEDTVVIAAVLHAARHDRHWQKRVE